MPQFYKDGKTATVNESQRQYYLAAGYSETPPEKEKLHLANYTKNQNYDPNDPSVNRYILSGTPATGIIQPQARQEAQVPPKIVATIPAGIRAAFGEGWQPAEIFKQKGLIDKGIQGAVRIAGSPDVFTIGQGGGWISSPEEYQKLFGTLEQQGIVGEISPEQAKLLGIRPEGVAEAKATAGKDSSMKELFNLAQQAGSSYEDAMKLVNSQYPTDTSGIRDELGIPDVVGKLFQTPSQTIQEIYQEGYNKSELPNLKTKIAEIDAQINKARGDLSTATNQVNANPWISEASRVGKMGQLSAQAENTINNLTNQRNQYLDMYDKGVSELEGVALREAQQYERQQTLYADQLNYLLGESERMTTEAQQKQISENLRYIPDYLKAMAASREATKKDTSIQEINGEKVLIDNQTGEIISRFGVEELNLGAGIVGGYDISTYATDSKHETAVANIYQRLSDQGVGDFNSIQKILNQYNAPFTGEQILDTAQKYNIDPKMIMAMIQQDSSYGTKGKGAKTFNPGNVGNTDSGATKNYGNWQAGLDAVGNWLNNHRSTNKTEKLSALSPQAQAILNGTLRLEDLTPTMKGQIAGELNAAGYKSTPKLSSAQQDEIATMETVKDLMTKVENYNADGKLEGVGGFWEGSLGGLLTKFFGAGSEEAKNVRALISNVKGTIAKLRGGTSFTPNEQKMLEAYTPTIDESAASVLSKIEMLKYAIDKKKTELLNVAQDRKLPSQTNPDLENLRTKYNY